MSLSVGSVAPEFSLPDQEGTIHVSEDYRGRWLLLYFYPEDDTPGCTKEACGFRDIKKDLEDRSCAILGVSPDTVESHRKFSDKHDLSFPILADPDKEQINAYGVWREKSFMGKKYMGVARTSFLIDPKGIMRKIYEGVKPEEHPLEVMKDLEELQKES